MPSSCQRPLLAVWSTVKPTLPSVPLTVTLIQLPLPLKTGQMAATRYKPVVAMLGVKRTTFVFELSPLPAVPPYAYTLLTFCSVRNGRSLTRDAVRCPRRSWMVAWCRLLRARNPAGCVAPESAAGHFRAGLLQRGDQVVDAEIDREIGAFCFSTAIAPATCGVAIEVPFQVAVPVPGTDEVMLLPGACSVSAADSLEKLEMASLSSVEPTLTAVEMQPGEEMPSEEPLLPAAMTVAMPTARSLSMAALMAASAASQAAVELMHAAAEAHVDGGDVDGGAEVEHVLEGEDDVGVVGDDARV